MKLSQIFFTIDLQNKMQFDHIIDKGSGWKAVVFYAGCFVLEIFFDDRCFRLDKE